MNFLHFSVYFGHLVDEYLSYYAGSTGVFKQQLLVRGYYGNLFILQVDLVVRGPFVYLVEVDLLVPDDAFAHPGDVSVLAVILDLSIDDWICWEYFL